jgi:hypothetical protein
MTVATIMEDTAMSMLNIAHASQAAYIAPTIHLVQETALTLFVVGVSLDVLLCDLRF